MKYNTITHNSDFYITILFHWYGAKAIAGCCPQTRHYPIIGNCYHTKHNKYLTAFSRKTKKKYG